jgi:hypothetical protein
MLADLAAAALLALGANAVMLADAAAATLLAARALAVMLADRGTAALLALGANAVMLADRGAAALLADRAPAVMLANTLAAALLADRALAPVRTRHAEKGSGIVVQKKIKKIFSRKNFSACFFLGKNFSPWRKRLLVQECQKIVNF